MELFGGIARQVTSTVEETEKAVAFMRPLFKEVVAMLKADVQAELQKYLCQEHFGRVSPLRGFLKKEGFLKHKGIPNDPVRLMRIAFPETKPGTRTELRRMWESRLLYYMTLQTLGMLLRDDPTYRSQLLSKVNVEDDEESSDDELLEDTDSEGAPEPEDVGLRAIMDADDMERVIDFLLAQGLIVDKGEDRKWSVYLDPKSKYRWTSETSGAIRRRFTIRACCIPGSKEVWFGVKARRKLLFRRWMKWVSRVGKVGQYTPDQIGVRLILQGDEDYKIGRAWFGSKLGISPGGTVPRGHLKQSATTDGAEGTSTSPYASKRFVADRIHLTIEGRLVEMQIVTAAMAANVTYSKGDENDRLYGMRRFWPFLQILRPFELYGIDWSDLAVREKNEQKVFADIHARLITA